MLRSLRVQNYKSILDCSVGLGRVTVLLGENGAGKSNILEAIGLFSASFLAGMRYEFLEHKGIRVSDPNTMHSCFRIGEEDRAIALVGEFSSEVRLSIEARFHTKSADRISLSLKEDNLDLVFGGGSEIAGPWSLSKMRNFMGQTHTPAVRLELLSMLLRTEKFLPESRFIYDVLYEIDDYMVYFPSYSTLRTFQKEGQVRPLGVQGEGLFSYLKYIAEKDPECFQEINERLKVFGWFDTMEVQRNGSPFETTLHIRDRYVDQSVVLDQRSVNEGFFFVLFYLVLLLGPDTPRCFAVDNIEASLNPALCRTLIEEIVKIAKEKDKQVILTTHNPAILDGLNLHDNEQRLLTVQRNDEGHTTVRRVKAPKVLPGMKTKKRLSELFLRGALGGLPEHF